MTAPVKHSAQELRLLQLLSARYSTMTAAHIEMINLHAILALPKGTDHYISDIHGAYEQFDHILRHASGAIQRKINQTFGHDLSPQDQVELAMLVYYPEQKLRQVLASLDDPQAWMAATVARLARVARTSSQKYTRSKVRKRLAPQFAYILEELLTEAQDDNDQKEHYYESIVRSIVALGEGENVIVTLAYLIQSLVVDRLYILGDIYDRGPAAEKVMDRLMAYHYVAIQWGNHDVSWMGAASGCEALIANVIRLSLRYANVETLLEGYDINLRRLARFAETTYGDDPCAFFQPKVGPPVEDYSRELIARMHKAIAILQFKLEAAIIRRHPEYAMEDRLVLDGINLAEGTVTLDGKTYPLLDRNLPTLDPLDPAALTDEEAAVVADLREQFQRSERLHTHIRFLYSYGNMFQVQDGNLKFHGCLPVDQQGEFIAFPLGGDTLAGPALLERYEQMAREAFFSHDPLAREAGQDAMWYLWCGQQSPLFGRLRMTTFERHFITDPTTHEEPEGPYYALRHSEVFCRKVLAAFGGDVEHGHIISGHTPVKVRKGESPLLANGKLIVIDGGMSEAYQAVTGIAGYTLIGNSHELVLAAHDAFISADEMIAQGIDVTPQTERIENFPQRVLIAATDTGQMLHGQLEDLQKLVDAYRSGMLVENVRGDRGCAAVGPKTKDEGRKTKVSLSVCVLHLSSFVVSYDGLVYTMHESQLDQLVQQVQASAKYHAVGEDVVRNIGQRELLARRNLKEAVKATKNKLHQVAGAYLDERFRYEAWLDELTAAQQSADEHLFKEACTRIMAHHASTRERAPILDTFYATLLPHIPTLHTVLDVGCGLNPLALPWMQPWLATDATYYACDIYSDMMAFLNDFFAITGITGQAEVRDLVATPPPQRVDVALILKVLPVLEQRDRAAGIALLRAINAPTLIVSFPTASLGGRNRHMVEHYERHFGALVEAEGWRTSRFPFASELAFLVRKDREED